MDLKPQLGQAVTPQYAIAPVEAEKLPWHKKDLTDAFLASGQRFREFALQRGNALLAELDKVPCAYAYLQIGLRDKRGKVVDELVGTLPLTAQKVPHLHFRRLLP